MREDDLSDVLRRGNILGRCLYGASEQKNMARITYGGASVFCSANHRRGRVRERGLRRFPTERFLSCSGRMSFLCFRTRQRCLLPPLRRVSGPVAMGQARRSHFMDRRSSLRCLRHFVEKKVPIVIGGIPARDRNHLCVASLSERHARPSGGGFFAIQPGDISYSRRPCDTATFRASGRIL